MESSAVLETVVLCVDGSDASTHAVATGFAVLQPAARVVVATVVEDMDPSLVTGTGFAGGVVSEAEVAEFEHATASEGREIVERTARALDVASADTRVLRGAPGPMLCALADEVAAAALVVGSRGRGGLKRALLGSVSDYVARNAPCPVVIVGPG